eukprot:NODE_933_length_2957_cov_0.476907.p2 type:complete len:135 gc:universal NODE_933_length_2957_cov_0.476907:2480-2076(-)
MVYNDTQMGYLTQFEFYKACFGAEAGLYQRFENTISPAIVAARNEVNGELQTSLTSQQFCRVAVEIIDKLSNNGNVITGKSRNFRQNGQETINGVKISRDTISNLLGDWCTPEIVGAVSRKSFTEQGKNNRVFT